MLTASHAPHRFLRIVLTIVAVIALIGCAVEDEASQTGSNDVPLSGSGSGSTGDGASVSTGSFTLSWTAPVTRQDGSPISLAEIDGYRIYYGENQGDYPNSVDVNDGVATDMTVSNVPMGSYYIVMTSYDADGRESTHSGVVSKQAL